MKCWYLNNLVQIGKKINKLNTFSGIKYKECVQAYNKSITIMIIIVTNEFSIQLKFPVDYLMKLASTYLKSHLAGTFHQSVAVLYAPHTDMSIDWLKNSINTIPYRFDISVAVLARSDYTYILVIFLYKFNNYIQDH